ncbi:MAG: hypothetical protein RL135_901 [Bacteroidota bacterium]|jgi:hypothetical protein
MNHFRNFILTLVCIFFVGSISAQKRFKVVYNEANTSVDSYLLVDEKGVIIKQLDTAIYYICFTQDTYGYFAVFGMKNFKGWAAIDAKEKILFNVYNASNGEPNPDILVEGKIRIVNSDNLIGFANSNGQVVIKPQFESVSTFYKGKAIIGKNCKEVPWDKHESENGCHHYSIVCRKHGYINTKGVVIKLGNFTFEKIMKEIGWKSPEEQYWK